MKKDLSEVGRLDVAARSLVTEAYISGMRVCLIFFSISIIISAMGHGGKGLLLHSADFPCPGDTLRPNQCEFLVPLAI